MMQIAQDCYAVELHCHLDGCVTPEIVFSAAKRKGIDLPIDCKCPNDLIQYISCARKHNSLKEVLDKFYFYLPIIANDKIAIKELCHSFAKQQFDQKIYYTEVRYCPHLLSGDAMTPEQVLIAILQCLREAAQYYGIIIKSLLCNMRSWKADKRASEITAFAVKYGKNNGGDVVGIDLAGNESASNSKDGWADIFHSAKHKHNLNITIHSGEALGPESIWDALNNLFADRIGHGYAAIHDKELMNKIQKEQIHLECCLSSSIITNAVEYGFEECEKHPMVLFNAYNINYSINSDDPVVLNCSYLGELDLITQKCGISKLDIAMSWIRSANASFLNEKVELVREITKRIQVYYLNNHVQILAFKNVN